MDSKSVMKIEIPIKREKEETPASRSVVSFLDRPPNSLELSQPIRGASPSVESQTSSAAIDQLLETEDAQHQLNLKQQKVRASKKFLAGLREWLQLNVDAVPVVGDWLEDIGAILKQNELPRLVLGLMGDSGCGKSSVINALIGEECLLPCNSSEACTAVAVEVAWNVESNNSRAYKARIQFFSSSEWKKELDSLVPQLLALPISERMNPTGDEAKVAAAKFKAVYPNISLDRLEGHSPSQLVNIMSISKLLGSQEEIVKSAGEGAQFAAEISQYIDSSKSNNPGSDRETLCWPLIKVVQIFTRSSVLATGLVLVDLPGLGDSNAARAIVAEDYMNQVSAICVVADIKRALTNAVAKNLYGRGAALKRRLRKGGLLDSEHTFFVLTCTDVIQNMEVIKALGLKDTNLTVSELLRRQEGISNDLKPKVQRRQALIERNKIRLPEITSLERDIQTVPMDEVASRSPRRKRKRTDNDENQSIESVNGCISGPIRTMPASESTAQQKYEEARKRLHNKKRAQMKAEEEIETVSKEIDDLNIELNSIEDDLKSLCIKKRNQYVQHRMEVDYSDGLREFERELCEEKEDQISTPILNQREFIQSKCVATFCVCSKAYQKLKGRFCLEQLPQGFLHAEDTQMPQLIQHCIDYTLPARDRLASAVLGDIDRLGRRMKEWGDNTTPDKQITMVQKRLLEGNFRVHFERLQKTISQSIELTIENLRQMLNNLDKEMVEKKVLTATNAALNIYEQWTLTIKNGPWKAICKKDGIHRFKKGSPDGIDYNWNEELAEPLTRYLDIYLNKLTSQYLPALRKDHNNRLEEAGKLFPRSLEESSMAITRHVANPLQDFLHNIQRLEIEMQRDIESRFAETAVICKTADSIIPNVIELAMKPGYDKAKCVVGSGAFKRSMKIIEDHINHVKRTMYEKAAKEAVLILKQSIIVLQSNLKSDLDLHIEKIEEKFSKMLEVASATARPESGPAKLKLQGETLRKLKEFHSALSEDAIKNSRYPECEDDPCFNSGNDEDSDRESIHRNGVEETANKACFQTFSDEEDSDDDDGQA